jgi:hypothetical protein
LKSVVFKSSSKENFSTFLRKKIFFPLNALDLNDNVKDYLKTLPHGCKVLPRVLDFQRNKRFVSLKI